jgi:sugar phosphate isomerase/epimerase
VAHDDILIGTIAQASKGADYVRQIAPYGFESFEYTFGGAIGDVDLKRLAEDTRRVLEEEGKGQVVSALGLYGNPLQEDEAARDIGRLIDACELFGAKVVAGFAGALEGKPIPESLPRFKEVFGPLVERAEDRGVRIAFENCPMGGTWRSARRNIAINPSAWALMFEAIDSPAMGLEWEPCHQMCQLMDPMAQLRQWAPKMYHLHGKDATVMWDVIRAKGVMSPEAYVFHRTPGFGDCSWTDIISVLRLKGFRGAIDIEGWHDPVYRGEREMTGQVHGMKYLKHCRGGDWAPNPA